MSKILIVDDDLSCRAPLARLLELEGYDTKMAEDGVEALDALAQDPPDLMVLDMFMPRMNGVQLLEKLRTDERYRELPVLLVTGVHDTKMMSKAKSLGVQEYLFKADTPFSKLLGLLQKHLGEPPSPTAQSGGQAHHKGH